MCVVRLCLQYQGRGGPLHIGTGAILGGRGGPFWVGLPLWRRSAYTPGLGECGRTYDQRPTGSCGRR